MSHKNVIDFLAYLKNTQDFAKQLESTESPEARAELMKAKGFVFSPKRHAGGEKCTDKEISGAVPLRRTYG